MRRSFLYILMSISITLLVVGMFFFFKGNSKWEKGIFFRKTFGYIGFVNEEVFVDLYYYNVKNDNKGFRKEETQIYLIGEDGQEIACDILLINTVHQNKDYLEQKITLKLNLSKEIVILQKLMAVQNGITYYYEIGDLVIENIITPNEIKKNVMEINYGNTFVSNKYDLIVTNKSQESFLLVEIKMNNNIFINNNKRNVIFYPLDSNTYIISLTENISKYDIVYIRPIIVMQYNSDEDLYYKVVTYRGEKIEQLPYYEVYEFTMIKAEVYK